jgi:hypothetical protein
MSDSYAISSGRRRWFTALLLLGLIGLSTLLGLAGWHVYQRFPPRKSRTEVIAVASASFPEHEQQRSMMYRCDDELGFSFNPGKFTLRLRSGQAYRTCQITIDADGHRICSPVERNDQGKPEVWFLGCSFTFGWPVNDADTFAWKVQQTLPHYFVRNLGGNAYSTTHALLQLRQAVRRGKPLPALALFAWCDFHAERNCLSRTWVETLKPHFAEHPELRLRYPWAALSGEHLVIEHCDVTQERGVVYSEALGQAVTSRLFTEMGSICRQHGITPILVRLHGDSSVRADPIARHAARLGYALVDAAIDTRDSGLLCLPFDGHPNERAHQQTADRLIAFLKNMPQPAPPEQEPRP